ncbi:MAG: hypothetical protein PHX78_04545 [bacterium]|nr:hypothetical protein [bacterium]
MLNNRSKILKTAYVGLCLCFLASCQNKEKVSEKQQGMQQMQQFPQAVPGAGSTWKAVKLIAKDKTNPNDKGKEFDVEIGGNAVLIPNSKLKIKVEEFFPDFFMDEQNKMASKSISLTNPAVAITVEEEGKPAYHGWLFAKYPDVHAFPHETISINLKDYIKK